jgi:hypothetical protein
LHDKEKSKDPVREKIERLKSRCERDKGSKGSGVKDVYIGNEECMRW